MKELEIFLQNLYEAKENGVIVNIKHASINVVLLANKINADITTKILKKKKVYRMLSFGDLRLKFVNETGKKLWTEHQEASAEYLQWLENTILNTQ